MYERTAILHAQERRLQGQWERRRQISGGLDSTDQPPFVQGSRTSRRGAFLLLSVCGISVLRDEVTVIGTDSREIMN